MAAPVGITNVSRDFIQNRRTLAYKTTTFEEINEISSLQFFKEYLIPNKPCIFNQSVTESWRSRFDWVKEDGTPNSNFLRHNFGDAVVPVANCKQEQYSSHPKQDWTLSQYLDYWEDYRATGYPGNKPCLYLKDWHFTKAFPTYKAYQTPVYFQSDWLNEFWDTRPLDDYRFVYMGPKGTWTPFHSDVYRSYSWSANICGKKKWIFYPPGCEEYLKDKFRNLIYDITSPELDDSVKYPHSGKVKDKKLEVIQGQGQIIFVPSGWHHQVYNLEDTISINHNWLNGCNIDICWEHLRDNLHGVKCEIDDLRDMDGWEEQCQLILNASAGINYETFIEMLKVIAVNRLEKIKSSYSETLCEKDRVCQNTMQGLQRNYDNELICNNHCDIKVESTSEQKCLTSFEDMLLEDMENVQNKLWKPSSEKVLKVDEVNTPDSSVTLQEDNPLDSTKPCGGDIISGRHAFIDADKFPKCSSEIQQKDNSKDDVSCDKLPDTLKDVACEGDITEEKWHIVFDLCRIKETLLDIIKDKDYMALMFDQERSAEYVYDLIVSSERDSIT